MTLGTSRRGDGVVLVLGIPDLSQGLASALCADFGSAPSTFRYASRKDWATLARDLRPASLQRRHHHRLA
ncbi:MAG TPA: hypothetical protein VMU94_15335 [Streptosporangiaceae bacterium]|nr:hypothetical protein [Streptosporangiaceae bacterium]